MMRWTLDCVGSGSEQFYAQKARLTLRRHRHTIGAYVLAAGGRTPVKCYVTLRELLAFYMYHIECHRT